jgi:deazaflavin-dependent oxidoreductase (nitroreductase family)
VARTYEVTAGLAAGNWIVGMLVRRGVGPRSTYLLGVVGRRTRQLRTTPVTLVETDEGRWLVAPYGAVGWVHNVRAAGHATLRRGRRIEEVTVVELGPQQAAPVLRAYMTKARIVRPYFDVTPESPIEDFVAEAPRHPVFALA